MEAGLRFFRDPLPHRLCNHHILTAPQGPQIAFATSPRLVQNPTNEIPVLYQTYPTGTPVLYLFRTAQTGVLYLCCTAKAPVLYTPKGASGASP